MKVMATPTSSYAPKGQALLFRKALRHFPTGVSVVTIREGTQVHGMTASSLMHEMTASSFSAVSLDPPLLSVSVNKPGGMHQLLDGADGIYALSILSHHQGDIADFYARMPWSVSMDVPMEWHDGCPVIAGSLAWFLCRKWATYDGGDHTIFVGESLSYGASDSPDLRPLVWHDSHYHDLGCQLARGSRPAVGCEVTK
jgi:flavin reductase